MTKKQLLATLALSTIALAQAGVVSADEVIPVDPTTPSTEVVTPTEPSTPEGPTEPSAPVEQPTDQTTPVDPTPSVPVDPTTPEETEPAVPAEPSNPAPSSPSTTEEPPASEPPALSTEVPSATEPAEGNGQTTPAPDQDKENADSQENPPAEKAQTTDQANQQGASQVGTTSTVTGQMVQNVAADAPVQTNTGASIVSTQDGQVILSDGATVAPEAIGAVTNTDKTITVTKADGTKATLPHTGDETTNFLTVVGAALLGLGGFLFKKRVI